MERQSQLGGEVGYHVRLDRKVSRDTRLIALTPGILLRQLMDDPFLEGVSCVLFDEAHERGLDSDLALAMVALARNTVRPDLAVGILSATLETERFSKWLGAPVIQAKAPIYPVDLRYSVLQKDRPWLDQVARQVRYIVGETSGDVLVFLPGVGEIQRLGRMLGDLPGMDILELHGELDPEKQDLALAKGFRRRIVLATNVAESSVTVDGVSVVVDTGSARTLVHDPSTGLDRLELGEISRASADQRAGRAGRQGPGICLRLWSLENHKS
jgi:ATP-dependent helicase HrpB